MLREENKIRWENCTASDSFTSLWYQSTGTVLEGTNKHAKKYANIIYKRKAALMSMKSL